MEPDGLGDDTTPAGLEGAEDIALGFSRGRRREQKRVREAQSRERDRQVGRHDGPLWRKRLVKRASYSSCWRFRRGSKNGSGGHRPAATCRADATSEHRDTRSTKTAVECAPVGRGGDSPLPFGFAGSPP